MKKLMYTSLAIAVGLVSTNALGQYPGGYSNNVGPSFYPVQTPYQGQTQSVLQNLPQVPQGFNTHAAGNQGVAFQQQQSPYQFVAGQGQVYGGGGYSPPPAPSAVPPTPSPLGIAPPAVANQSFAAAPAAPGSQSFAQPAHAAPDVNYGYQQSVAPNCASCGPTPISGSYGAAYGNTGYARGGRMAGLGALPAGAKPWFFGASALIFNRVDDHSRPLSIRDADGMDVLFTGDAQMHATGGFEVSAGRYFNCGRNAIVGSYWGIFPGTESTFIRSGGTGDFRSRIFAGESTAPNFIPSDVIMPQDPTGAANPNGVYEWFDGAYDHRVQRSSQFQNVEINLLGFGVGRAARNFNRAIAGTMFSGTRGCGSCGGSGCGSCGGGAARFATGPTGYIAPNCGSRLNLTWLAGLRYFRFEDTFQYAASYDTDGITRDVNDLYYDVQTTNDLVGCQFGGRGDYCVGKRLNLYTSGKAGVYGNRSTLYSRIGNDFATAYEGGMPGTTYLVNESSTDVAFLTELETGLGIRVSPKWTATVGYRGVAATGVATAVGNIRSPRDFVSDQRYIDNRDALILHGFTIGALYNY